MTLDLETFRRAGELYDHRSLCEHEAGHAAAALILGLDVQEARAPFRTVKDAEQADPDEAAGYVLLDRTGIEDDPALAHAHAVTVLAGPIADGKANWPPAWPLSRVPDTPDARQLAEFVEILGLDGKGYRELVDAALDLTGSREFERLHAGFSYALEQHGRLDAIALHRIKAITEEKDMEHTTKAATVTATEQGEFTAIAAAYSVDRVNDQIIPGAFATTIERWRMSGKRMPLHWNHQGEAANVIGYIDPASMRETSEGLQVSGRLDIDTSDVAREAWRSMKNNAMSLSFGYVTTRQRKRDDGINELHELDLFEVSIVPAPANSDTRVIEMKSMDDLEHVRTEWRDQLAGVLGHAVSATLRTKDSDTLRAEAKRIAREHAPITVTEFPC